MAKIMQKSIDECDAQIFGDWLESNLNVETNPYAHIIIDDFLSKKEFESIFQEWPEKPDENWFAYTNPIEVKFAYDKIQHMLPRTKNFFCALSHPTVVQKLRQTLRAIKTS